MNGELLRQGRPPEMVTGIAVSGVWPLCRALHPMLDVFCIPFNTHDNPRRYEFHSHFMGKENRVSEIMEFVAVWQLDA